jgi:DUF1680 family protein
MTQPAAPQPGNGPVVPTGAAAVTHRPLAGAAARITAGLLHDWQRRNATASLPLALRQLEVAGNLANLRLAVAGAHQGYQGPVFMDSDLYKTLEAIGWELARTGDGTAAGPDDLVSFVTEATSLLEKAQQPDGYLNSDLQVTGKPRYAALDTLYLHQFTGAELTAPLAGGELAMRMINSYPWSGRIEIQVTSAPPGPAGLAPRRPAWAATPHLWLNGQSVPAASAGAGYLLVHRRWRPGDVLRYELDLTPG